jgi:UDP-N-acetyl-2-amino-2-deoxyglucuronate dehydrogenase
MAVQPVRVGIIGCGVIGPTHIESYQRIEGVEVRWACDTDKARAEAIAAKFGIPNVTDDLNEVYADGEVDLVSICTDHAGHAEQVVLAFESGKHVLCEKALGATEDDLTRMLNAHAVHDTCLFGGIFQHRFDGVNRCLKQIIDEGAFGTILTTTMQLRCYREPSYYDDYWHGTWALEGGSVLINQAIHFVDTVTWLMGGVHSVAAHYDNRGHAGQIETEDVITASVRYADGSLGTLEAISASNLNWEHAIEIHGTDGSVELRDGQATKVAFADDAVTKAMRARFDQANDPTGVDAGKSYYGTGHPAQIADMVDAVRQSREPFVTGESAAQTVRVVLAAYESHRTGKRIELTPSQTTA